MKIADLIQAERMAAENRRKIDQDARKAMGIADSNHPVARLMDRIAGAAFEHGRAALALAQARGTAPAPEVQEEPAADLTLFNECFAETAKRHPARVTPTDPRPARVQS